MSNDLNNDNKALKVSETELEQEAIETTLSQEAEEGFTVNISCS